MSIILKPEHEQFIQAQLATGQYGSPDEVLSEAFRLLEERHKRLEELRQKVALGTEQIQKGQTTDGEMVFVRLQAKLNQMSQPDT